MVSLEGVGFLLLLNAEGDYGEQYSYRKGTRMQGLHEKIGFSLLLIRRNSIWVICGIYEREGPELPNFTYNK